MGGGVGGGEAERAEVFKRARGIWGIADDRHGDVLVFDQRRRGDGEHAPDSHSGIGWADEVGELAVSGCRRRGCTGAAAAEEDGGCCGRWLCTQMCIYASHMRPCGSSAGRFCIDGTFSREHLDSLAHGPGAYRRCAPVQGLCLGGGDAVSGMDALSLTRTVSRRRRGDG